MQKVPVQLLELPSRETRWIAHRKGQIADVRSSVDTVSLQLAVHAKVIRPRTQLNAECLEKRFSFRFVV